MQIPDSWADNNRHATRGRHTADGRRDRSLGNLLVVSHRRHTFNVNRQMRARSLHVSLLQEIQPVGPVLHHPAPWLNVLGMVVRRADLVGIGMGQLGIHPDLGIANLVERSRQRATDAMAGQLVFVAHPAQSTVERVFADALLELAAVRQKIALGRLHFTEKVPHDLNGLQGQRNHIGGTSCGRLPALRISSCNCLTNSGGMIHRPRSRSN